jgi:hypothetical protein
MKLGKKDFKHDPKTVKLASLLDADFHVPSIYDFDKGRSAFPTDTYSNTKYGDCVMAGRTNHLLRLERVETRRTPRITAKMVVDKYFELTGGEDTGLVVLEALRDWRKGWEIKSQAGKRNYKIAAFGQLNHSDPKQLRLGCYILHGVQFGFGLPISAQAQTNEGYWDVVDGPEGEPYSWGGHLVASFAFDSENFYVITWGKKVRVTQAFIEKYCDEAWAVVDNLDEWREAFDVEGMKQKLKEIGASGIE